MNQENGYIVNGDSRHMRQVPSGCVPLIVTSPPYNVGKEYESDMPFPEYMDMLGDVFEECRRVLIPGGRICINVANVGRKPYIPLASHITTTMILLGFKMRGEIIWDKGASVGSSTAWGSWRSPSNPTLRDVHEYILVFSAGSMGRDAPMVDPEATISSEEFTEYTKSIWKMKTASAKSVGHPAPFPVELPYRCIQLYTWKNETVLDPFMGSGTTALAAIATRRRYIGYEIDEQYCQLASRRIREYNRQDKLL